MENGEANAQDVVQGGERHQESEGGSRVHVEGDHELYHVAVQRSRVHREQTDARGVETGFGLRYPEEGERPLFSQHGPGFPAHVEHDADRAGEKKGAKKTEQGSAEKRSSKEAQEKQKERAQKTQKQSPSAALDEEEGPRDENEADGVHEMQVHQEDQGHSRPE